MNESSIIDLISIDGYEIAHLALRSSTRHLLRVI